ncbi:MAG: mechanosensitive ion channel family protein [Deltaproteobacteria bacterium]|nr:mechanosensitive ion channel family protein [Deltaproteobacteria bacterium]
MSTIQEWLRAHLPDLLQEPGPAGMLWWQWWGLWVVLSAALLFGVALGRVSSRLLARAARRTRVTWDDALALQASRPLTLAWTVVLAWVALPYLALEPTAGHGVRTALRVMLLFALFFMAYRAIDVLRHAVAQSAWVHERQASRALVPLAARIAKVTVVVFAFVALLGALGYPVASLVAGLGIGGLAVALAAQKTLENLFGAFTLGADQPFREGDLVRVDDVSGTVEAIGLRSTKIRTLDRTVVSFPNGKLAEMRLETFAARDRIRLATQVVLAHHTSRAQLEQVCAQVTQALAAGPKTCADGMSVRVTEITPQGIVIGITAWFDTIDWDEFLRRREAVLLQAIDVVAAAGARFAALPSTPTELGPKQPSR